MVEARNALANLVKHETRRASDFIILSRPKTRSRLYGIRGFSFLCQLLILRSSRGFREAVKDTLDVFLLGGLPHGIKRAIAVIVRVVAEPNCRQPTAEKEG